MTAGQKRRFDCLPFTPFFLILPIDAQLYRFAVDHKRAVAVAQSGLG